MLSLFSNEREMVILPQTKIVRFNNQWQVAKTMGKVAYVLKEKPKKLNKADGNLGVADGSLNRLALRVYIEVVHPFGLGP